MVKVGQNVMLDTQGEESSPLMTGFVAVALLASALQSGFADEIKSARQAFSQAVEMVRPLPKAPVVPAPRNP